MAGQGTVVVAMSGGVDSSVSAATLVEQGYRVIGMMLNLWSEPGAEAFNRCCTPEAMGLARRVAAHLDIPFYAVDVRAEFRETVVQYFLDGYTNGITPNPCLVCNQHIRFGTLLAHAQSLGAEALATGHFARVQKEGTTFRLLRGADPRKDQSYVLHVLNQRQLSRARFPVGELTKDQVRDRAREHGLPVAERSESQDLCFLAGDDYRRFLARHAPASASPGPILDGNGAKLGTHAGLAGYTIGQRKGLGISSSQPLYVIDKDMARNALIVGPKNEQGSLRLTAHPVNWISGDQPKEPFRAQIKIRYSTGMAWGHVTPAGPDTAEIEFDEPKAGVTPGQAAVFYDGECCLGGGIIVRRR